MLVQARLRHENGLNGELEGRLESPMALAGSSGSLDVGKHSNGGHRADLPIVMVCSHPGRCLASGPERVEVVVVVVEGMNVLPSERLEAIERQSSWNGQEIPRGWPSLPPVLRPDHRDCYGCHFLLLRSRWSSR